MEQTEFDLSGKTRSGSGSGVEAKDMVSKFWKFHRENPQVYSSLLAMALKLKANGRKEFAIDNLFGVLRWERAIQTQDDSGFKLCNNHRAFYARYLMVRNPILFGFFDVKSSVADHMFEHRDSDCCIL